jgi:VWFA-related protein
MLLSLPCLNLTAGVASAQQPDAGFVSFALPASGEVRVENQRGGVEVEVWDEASAAVAYVAQPEKTLAKGRRRSPVQIGRTDALLSIAVPRGTLAKPSPVQLRLRLPRNARAKIFTSDGAVEVRGTPAQLFVQTVSGDVRLSVARGEGAAVSAHSLNGTVNFEPEGGARAEQYVRQKFQTRLGAGGSVVQLFSGRGQISISTSSAAARAESFPTERPTPQRPRAETPSVVAPRVSETPAAAEETTRGEARPPVLAVEGAAKGEGQPDTHPSNAPQEVDEDEVIRVDSELVTVNVSVVDRAQGRGLTGLRQEDFTLQEDGVEQSIEHFEAASAPFDLLLLIDLSGSTGRVTDLIRAAAVSFIDAARPQDRIAVITFASETRVVSPLTTDRDRLRAAVRAMEPPKGDTRLYDAGAFALEWMDREASRQRRRAVVLLSDGLDSTMPNVTGTGSRLTFEELRDRVQEFEGLFYSIWTSTEYEALSPLDIQPETFDLAADRMEALADTGGGDFYDVEKLEDLAGAYARVVEALGTVYSLSYRPTNRVRDGRFRTIRVRLPRHPQAVARGKRGYYAN